MSSKEFCHLLLQVRTNVSYVRKSLHIKKTYSDIIVLFMERNRLNVTFAHTRLQEKISWFHIKKYIPRVPLIKPLTENLKMKLKLSSHLRKSIFPTKLNNHPTLNGKSHIKTQLHFPNIHDQKPLLIQSIMINF